MDRILPKKVPVILQNKNGPCPLINICNVLLLRNQMKLEFNTEIISNENLIQKLADILFGVFVPRILDQRKNTYQKYNLIEQNINDALSIFERLQYGLNVNVKFSACTHFEYTKEIEIFDLFSINLYHGWLIDPEQKNFYNNFGEMSYNQLIEIILNSSDSDFSSKKDDDQKFLLNVLADDFLKTTASQLTYYGLSSLHDTLGSSELAVLFRNNHFSTIFKHPQNNCLYTLVTDSGYLNHPEIVWETLDNIEGAGNFCDANFKLVETIQNFTTVKPIPSECQNE